MDPDLTAPLKPTKNDVAPISKRTWISFIFAQYIQLAAGALYAFSVYGPDLKNTLGYTQSEINLVGELGNVGQYMGPISGIIFAVFDTRIGSFIGLCLVFPGYFLSFLVADGRLDALSSPGALGFCGLLAGLGSQTMGICALSSTVLNMPFQYRGIVVGINIAFISLASPVFTAIYGTFFGDTANVSGFFLFYTILASSAAVCGMFFVQSAYEAPALKDIPRPTSKEHVKAVVDTFLTLIKSPVWWIIFVLYFIEEGTILFLTVNAGNLIKALNDDIVNTGVLTISSIVFAIFNIGGRLAYGLTDLVRVRRGWWLFAAFMYGALGSLLSALLLTDGNFTRLYGLSVVSGGAAAMAGTGITTIVSECFGAERFSQAYGWTILAAAPASFAFNGLAGSIYDTTLSNHVDQGIPRPTDDSGNILHDCVGADCFTNTWWIIAGISVAAALLTLTIVKYTEYGKKDIVLTPEIGTDVRESFGGAGSRKPSKKRSTLVSV